MDKSFKTIVKYYMPVANLSHQQQVMRLYRRCVENMGELDEEMRKLRKSLRNLISWTESREVLNFEATKVRMRFNENKNVDIDTGKRLLAEGQNELLAQTHADPYIPPYMPGGSLFMRNPALPLEALFPDGIPSHINKRRINIDMSNVPDDQEFGNKVLVDSISKQYWIDK